MTKAVKIEALKKGQIVSANIWGVKQKVIVIEKPESYVSWFGEIKWIVKVLTNEGNYLHMGSTNEPKLLSTKGALAQKTRSDGFIFTVAAIGKKRVVQAGCRSLPSVKKAIEFWHDEHDVRLTPSSQIDERRKLNAESRKLVTQLASRVDKKMIGIQITKEVDRSRAAKAKKSVKKKSRK